MIDWNLGHRGARRRFDKLTGLIMSLLPEVRLFRRRGPPGGGVVCHPLGIQSCREVGPARVGERDPFVGGRDDCRHLARRPDACGELPCLRPPTLTAHTNLDMEDVSSAVAHHLHDSLLVARLHDPHAGRPRTVRHEHFFMAVRAILGRLDLGHPLSVEKHAGRAARPHRDLLRALWQGDVAADPHDERCCAVGPQARFVVSLRQVGEGEERAGERLRGTAATEIPTAVRHTLDDLAEHGGLGHRGECDDRNRRHGLVHHPAGGDPLWRHDRAMNRHVVEQTRKRVGHVAVDRGADPDLVIVDHRRLRGGAAEIPCARHGLAIDVAADRIRLAERVAHGDMVPAGARGEAFVGDPAMKILCVSLPVVGVAKEKTRPGQAAGCREPQGPVLVVGGDLRVRCASLADDVDLLAVGEFERVHPGLERNGVAIRELELGEPGRAARNFQDAATGPEEGGGVFFLAVRMPWRPRSLFAEDDRAAHLRRQRLCREPFRGRPLGAGRLFEPPDCQRAVGQHFLIGGGFRRDIRCEDILHGRAGVPREQSECHDGGDNSTTTFL